MKLPITDPAHPAIALVGRILLALIFVVSGFGKVMNYGGTAAYMASAGLPMVGLLLPLTIAVELGGGLLIAFGLFTRPVAIIVFLFLIPVSLAFHHFWDVPAAQAMTQQIQFMKNVAIMGGMLMLAFAGPGSLSMDARRAR
ncbi:MAG: DoxX family protein [Burkholderiaceae bacterium]